MLNRWFFRWAQEDAIVDRISGLPCSAVSGTAGLGAYLVEQPGTLIVIGFHPPFWKLERKTWYRQSIRKAVIGIAGFKPAKTFSSHTMMVWSNDEFLFPEHPERHKFRISKSPTDEAALAWSWIMHVSRLPVAQQRSMKLFDEEFETWRRATDKQRKLPSPPVPRRR